MTTAARSTRTAIRQRMGPGVRRNARSLALLLFTVIAVVFIGSQSSHYLAANNIRVLGLQISFEGIGALGTLFLIVGGYVDLAIGSIFAMVATFSALLAAKGVPVPLAWLGGIALGGVAGLVDGILVWRLRVSPIIVTLGMLLAYQGIVDVYTQGYAVLGVPEDFKAFGGALIAGIPTPIIVLSIGVAVASVVLGRTTVGRHVYAIGGNSEAATAAGVRVRRLVIGMFVVNGLIVGVAAVLAASRIGTADPHFGTGYLFDVLTIVVLGGVAFQGGEGSVFGVVVALGFYGVLTSGMVALGVDPYWVDTFKGVALIGAVAIDQLTVEQRAARQKRLALETIME